MRHQHHRGQKHGPFSDLPSESKDGILLEALLDVEDILVLECNKAHLLQTTGTGLLDELHHRLRRREELSLEGSVFVLSQQHSRHQNRTDKNTHVCENTEVQ